MTTTHDNIVATRRFSAWLLHVVPMPRQAREWRRPPTPEVRHPGIWLGPSDPAFTRTTWWTVPVSREAFETRLRAHARPGLRAESDAGESIESDGSWEKDLDFFAPGTTAHTDGWLNFGFRSYGDGLVVRVDTFVGARFARTVLVPTDTTSVTIRRIEQSVRPHSGPHRKVRTLTAPAAVAHLVDMVNRLPGAQTAPFDASCPAARSQRRYSMTFVTPEGAYVASLPTTTCWPRLTLTHDGAKAGSPLDPGRRFVTAAERHLR